MTATPDGKLIDGRGGFTIVENGVLSMRLTPYELAVYVAIISHASADTHRAWPSHARISQVSGVKITTLKKCLKALRARGLLKIEPGDRDDGGRATNIYTILPVASTGKGRQTTTPSRQTTIPPSSDDYAPSRQTTNPPSPDGHKQDSSNKTHSEQEKKKIAAAKTAAAAPRSAPPSIIQSPSEPATLPPSTKPKKQKPEPPASSDDPKKQRDAALAELIAAWKDSTGDLNPNVYANKTIRAGAGAMVDAGITVQDVTAYLDDLTTDDWWSSRAVPFSHVVSNIQAWKREAEVYANYEVPKPDLPETDLTWEELRAMGEELKKTLAERNSLQAVIARADAEYKSPGDRLRDHMAARGEQLP